MYRAGACCRAQSAFSPEEHRDAPQENPDSPKENPDSPEESADSPRENPDSPEENPHSHPAHASAALPKSDATPVRTSSKRSLES